MFFFIDFGLFPFDLLGVLSLFQWVGYWTGFEYIFTRV